MCHKIIQMANKQMINDSLKFEISRFSDSCIEIYKNMIEENIKKSFEQIRDKIESEIKTNIAQKIGGNDLYDYCNYPALIKFKVPFDNSNCKEYDFNQIINYLHISQQSDARDFLNFADGEKIIIYEPCKYNHSIHGFPQEHFIWITNFGNIFCIVRSSNFGPCPSLFKNNFWLPIDYIQIIKLMFTKNQEYMNNGNCMNWSNFDPSCISTIMSCMKNNLYNRKIIPLYIKDVIEENNKLKSMYDNYKIEHDKFEERKKDFEEKNKPQLDVLKEYEEIKKQKEQLRLVVLKLELDRKKLEEDMIKINEEKRKIDSINVSFLDK